MEFKDLSFKKKIEHIWEYYKIPILTVLLIAFVAGTWAYDAKFKPRKELFSGVAFLNYKAPIDYDTELYESVNEALGLTDTNSEVKLEYFYDDDQETDFMSEMLAKFAAMLLTGDVNIMIMDKDSMYEYAADDYLLDLSLIYTDEELQKPEEEGLLLKSASNLDKDAKFYAISLKNSKILKDLPKFDLENNYIAIYGAVENTENPKKVVDLMTGLFDNQ